MHIFRSCRGTARRVTDGGGRGVEEVGRWRRVVEVGKHSADTVLYGG